MNNRFARSASRLWFVVIGSLILSPPASGQSETPKPIKATSTNPAIASRQEKIVHGVTWGLSYAQATEVAQADRKPVLIHFAAITTPASRVMEQTVLPHPEIAPLLAHFSTVRLDVDYAPINSLTKEQRLKLAEANMQLMLEMTSKATTPQFVVIDMTGKLVSSIEGNRKTPEFVEFLTGSLTKVRVSTK